jgi:DNA processing protein
MNDRVITPSDEEWPDQLNELGPTRGLVEAGFSIVSGLAIGIDAVAHRTALASGGYTIAVLGCGLDIDYPQKNAALRRKIERAGTLVSEYPPGSPPASFHFPERNRIIAGLAAGVLYVEGSERSGGRITARAALDANRAVFAVPGSIRNPLACGPNELIRTSQAALVMHVKHICDELEPGLVWDEPVDWGPVRSPVTLSDPEERVLGFLDDAPAAIDLIAKGVGLKPGEAAMALSRLEIRGFVTRRRDGYELSNAGARVRTRLVAEEAAAAR